MGHHEHDWGAGSSLLPSTSAVDKLDLLDSLLLEQHDGGCGWCLSPSQGDSSLAFQAPNKALSIASSPSSSSTTSSASSTSDLSSPVPPGQLSEESAVDLEVALVAAKEFEEELQQKQKTPVSPADASESGAPAKAVEPSGGGIGVARRVDKSSDASERCDVPACPLTPTQSTVTRPLRCSRPMPDPPAGTAHWVEPLWAALQADYEDRPPPFREVSLESLCTGTGAELHAIEVSLACSKTGSQRQGVTQEREDCY